jgi:hypothetical protein
LGEKMFRCENIKYLKYLEKNIWFVREAWLREQNRLTSPATMMFGKGGRMPLRPNTLRVQNW